MVDDEAPVPKLTIHALPPPPARIEDVQKEVGGVLGNAALSMAGFWRVSSTIDSSSAMVGRRQPPPAVSRLAQTVAAFGCGDDPPVATCCHVSWVRVSWTVPGMGNA
jgi:hypothetical protein